jgi:hypothetical protein
MNKIQITFDDFITEKTDLGNVTVRWTHNHKAIKTFFNYDTSLRATKFIRFLVDWYNSPENFKIKESLLSHISERKNDNEN